MIQVLQTTFGGPDDPADQAGNCMAACIASIFHLPLEEVDDALRHRMTDDRWFLAIADHALSIERVVLYSSNPEEMATHLENNDLGFGLASVDSPRGDWEHAVVVDRQGRIVWDPHPHQDGYDLPVKDVMVWVPKAWVDGWRETEPAWKGFDPTYRSWFETADAS